MRHIALYLFQGLRPSPQVEMKFKPETEDPINGSKFIFKAFGYAPAKPIKRYHHLNVSSHHLILRILFLLKKHIRIGRFIQC